MLEQLKRKRLQKLDLLSFHNPYYSDIWWNGDWVYASNQISKLGTPRVITKVKESPNVFKASNLKFLLPKNALGVNYNLIYCPSGSFNFSLTKYSTKGSPSFRDEYIAEIKKPFLLGETEVTRELYYTVMGLTDDPMYRSEYLQSPMNRESLIEYLRFCNRLSELENLEACYTFELVDEMFWGEMTKVDAFQFDPSKNGYRLPTSEEWQYAAKAGTDNAWSGTNDPQKLKDYAVISTHNDRLSKPQIVKQRKPNAWGFYDMTGNVQELVSESSRKIYRTHGGHYLCMADYAISCRSDVRLDHTASRGDQTIGFRIARTLG